MTTHYVGITQLAAAYRLRASLKTSFSDFVKATADCGKSYANLDIAFRKNVTEKELVSLRKLRNAARANLTVKGAAFETALIASLKKAGFKNVKPTSKKVTKVSMLGWVGAHYGALVAKGKSVSVYIEYSDQVIYGEDSAYTAFLYVNGKAVAQYKSSPSQTAIGIIKTIKPADLIKALAPSLQRLEETDYKDLQ